MALMNSNYSQPINLGNPVEHTINGEWNYRLEVLVEIIFLLLNRVRVDHQKFGGGT